VRSKTRTALGAGSLLLLGGAGWLGLHGKAPLLTWGFYVPGIGISFRSYP